MPYWQFPAEAAASVPTPGAGRVNMFFNLDTGLPSYKDDTGAVHSLVGTVGPAGQPGVPLFQGEDPEDPIFLPGVPGPTGGTGPTGASTSIFQYRASTVATSGDPGDGKVIWDNATQISATQINIDHLTNDSIDIDLFLAVLVQGNRFYLQDKDDSSNYQLWEVSGAITIVPNDYVEVPVTLVTSAGTGTTNFANNHNLILAIIRIGPAGSTGSQGPVGPPAMVMMEDPEEPLILPGPRGADGAPGAPGGGGSSALSYYLTDQIR